VVIFFCTNDEDGKMQKNAEINAATQTSPRWKDLVEIYNFTMN